MSVQPLTTLILQSLPLQTIIEQNLLLEALAPLDLKIMKDRFTLENLKKEGLLNKELDPMIFYLALEKACPNFIWLYMYWAPFDYDKIPKFTPLSPEGLKWLEENCDKDKVKNELRESLGDLRNDILIILDNPGKSLNNGGMVIIWDYFDGKYRLFSYNTATSDGHLMSSADDLDGFIRNIYEVFTEGGWFERIFPQFIKIDTLSDDLTSGFDALLQIKRVQERTKEIIKALWEEKKTILTMGELHLTLGKLSKRVAEIKVIGDNLHFFYWKGERQYFEKAEGELVIASLVFNQDKWKYVE